MDPHVSFDERVASRLDRMSPAEQRVARVFQENPEEVLYASAAELAAKAATSDATVVRATKALGFSGMEELRRVLAAELKQALSPARRLAETLKEVGDDLQAAFDKTLDIHLSTIGDLRRDIAPDTFRQAVELICGAKRIAAFGLGPSSAIAAYLAIQLSRFGIDAISLTRAGLLFADDLATLRQGDLVVILAYSRIYPEVSALLDEADRLRLKRILVTDTLGAALRRRVDFTLTVARGRTDMLSMHTGTLGLFEALLVGVAASRPQETLAALRSLNALRSKLVGESMGLPTPETDA
jgi:DNA-binding MurR/RpiR family transcriptional regulator